MKPLIEIREKNRSDRVWIIVKIVERYWFRHRALRMEV